MKLENDSVGGALDNQAMAITESPSSIIHIFVGVPFQTFALINIEINPSLGYASFHPVPHCL